MTARRFTKALFLLSEDAYGAPIKDDSDTRMPWSNNLYFLTNIIAFTVMAVVIFHAWKNRIIIGAGAFIALALLLEWGILVDGIAMLSPDGTVALFWFSLRFIALAGVPPAWLVFTLHYTGRIKGLTPVRYAMLFSIPVITQIILWTNDLHGMWVAHDVSFHREGLFMIADTNARVPGPWFMVHTVYGYLCLVFGIALIFQWSYHMMRIYRAQAMALWVGMIIMTAGSAIPTFKVIPGLKVNPVMLTLVMSSLLFAWATFRYRFLDIVPVARDRLVDSMDDCMIVLDSRNRVVDINPPMKTLLAEASAEKKAIIQERMIGQPIAAYLGPWRDLVWPYRDASDIQTEIAITIDGSERFYDLKISPLFEKGSEDGRIVILRNITARKIIEDEHKLSEARLDALYQLSQKELPTEKETIDYALEEAVRLTESEIGYFHLVKEDQESLELFTWSREVMKTCTAATDRHYPLSMAGIWADCARTKRPVIHNDYQNIPDRKGYPEGHSHIIRHMSVPILTRGAVKAISGVANKEGPYNDSDLRQLQLFMDGLWNIIERNRVKAELASAMKEKETLLQDLMVSEHLLKERNDKMENDLKIAQTVQKAIMKYTSPACSRLAVDVRYLPLERLGGDYFSFFDVPDNSMGIFIGDVTGHGIAASLFTALLKSATTRVFRDYGSSPSSFLKNLNDELLDYMSSYFVTGIYGLFSPCGDDSSMAFTFSIGAHPLPIIKRRGGDFTLSGVSSDIIGLADDVHFTDTVEELMPGDRVFLYTDGVPESINPRRETLGFGEGLLSLFRRADRPVLSDMLDAVLDGITRHREGNPMRDDATIIGIEVR